MNYVVAFLFIGAVLAQGEYSISINPSVFPVQGSTTVQWTAPQDHSPYDHIGWVFVNETSGDFTPLSQFVVPTNKTSGSFTFSSFTNIPHVGTYRAVYIMHENGDIPANATGQANYSGYSLQITQNNFTIETNGLSLSWNAPPTHGANDRIGWYALLPNGTTVTKFFSASSSSNRYTLPTSATAYYAQYTGIYYIADGSVAASVSAVSNIAGFSVSFVNSTFPVQSSGASVQWTIPAYSGVYDYIDVSYINPNGTLQLLYSKSVSYSSTQPLTYLQILYSGTYVVQLRTSVGQYILEAYATALVEGYALVASPNTAEVGEDIATIWDAPAGHSASCIIYWYSTSNSTSPIKTGYINSGGLTGSMIFKPTAPGHYYATFALYSTLEVAAQSNTVAISGNKE